MRRSKTSILFLNDPILFPNTPKESTYNDLLTFSFRVCSTVASALLIFVCLETFYEVESLTFGGNWARRNRSVRQKQKTDEKVRKLVMKQMKMLLKKKMAEDLMKMADRLL